MSIQLTREGMERSSILLIFGVLLTHESPQWLTGAHESSQRWSMPRGIQAVDESEQRQSTSHKELQGGRPKGSPRKQTQGSIFSRIGYHRSTVNQPEGGGK